jgi:hypothetical protein
MVSVSPSASHLRVSLFGNFTGFEITTVYGVMRKLLRDAPVKILKICARDNARHIPR